MKIRDDAWLISDTHFHHSNIIKYCDRPFRDAAEMDTVLVSNWNSVVGKHDQVLFLGDFAFAQAQEIHDLLSKLNGEIFHILGNHDRGHSSQFWLDAGMSFVSEYPIVYHDFFIFSHEPLEWVSEKLPICNIHGHVHEKTMYNFTNHHFNASVENIGYTPIRLNIILDQCIDLNRR